MRRDLYYWSICATILSLISVIIHPSLAGIGILNLMVLAVILIIGNANNQLDFIFDLLAKFYYRRRLANTTYVVGGTFAFLDAFSTPANAQFFGKAEVFMKTALKPAGTAVQGAASNDTDFLVSLVFNVLRGFLLIYFGVALINIVIQFRNNEDWQSAAKLPLTILVVLTLGDVLSQMIIGDGTGGSPLQEV